MNTVKCLLGAGLCLYSLVLHAQTNVLGNLDVGDFLSTRACPSNHILIGFEVRWGATGIGQVRGNCRQFNQNNQWAGTSIMTKWTSISGSGSYTTTHESTLCPADQAVTGIIGAVEGTTSANINNLGLLCRQVSSTGVATGVTETAPNVGASGGTGTDPFPCPDDTLATGIIAKSRQQLHGIRLECAVGGLQANVVRKYSIRGVLRVGNVVKRAIEQGFQFDAIRLPHSSEGSNCDITYQRSGVRLITDIPQSTAVILSARVKCEFRLFKGNISLAPGWSLVSASFSYEDGPDPGPCDRSFGNTILNDDDDPFFSIIYECHSPNEEYLMSGLVFVGPDGGEWQDAFAE